MSTTIRTSSPTIITASNHNLYPVILYLLTAIYISIVAILILNPFYKYFWQIDIILIDIANILVIITLYSYIYIWIHYINRINKK